MKLFAIYTSPDGLRGITTPLPLDPLYCQQYQINICDMPICVCDRRERDHDAAFQLCKDNSILMEDQEVAKRKLIEGPYENTIFDIPYTYGNPRPGVYPLSEPLDTIEVYQYKHIEAKEWSSCPKWKYESCSKDKLYKTQIVLRISQGTEPDTRLKTGELVGAEGVDFTQDFSGVKPPKQEEGSESTCTKPNCNCMQQYADEIEQDVHTLKSHKCYKPAPGFTRKSESQTSQSESAREDYFNRSRGGEEKKEPEKLISVPSYQEKGAMKHINEKRNKMPYPPKRVSLRSEEPTQEELWNEVENYYLYEGVATFGKSGKLHIWRKVYEKYHITRRA